MIPPLTPLRFYQFAQAFAQQEALLFGPRALIPAQRVREGWWTPMFPSLFLSAPHAKRRG